MQCQCQCQQLTILSTPRLPRHDISQWLPSGDAFKIQDLATLEGETLPTYFRHQRFASLIRQLNFYSFRKVNKERNFWVYRHPLFHRDRPEELHLVRRQTIQGVDGRKHRPEFDIASLEKGAASSLDERGAPIKKSGKKKIGAAAKSPAAKKTAKKTPKRSAAPVEVTPTPKKKRTSKTFVSTPAKLVKSADDSDSSDDEGAITSRTTKTATPFGGILMSPRAQMKGSYPRQVSLTDMSTSSGTKTPPGRDHILLQAANASDVDRFEQKQQSVLVAEVSMALEEHLKRAKSAAAATALGGKKSSAAAARRVSVLGSVTPITDTMKYNGLSYDDNIVERDEDVIGIIAKTKVETGTGKAKASQSVAIDIDMEEPVEASTTGIVTDGDESEDDSASLHSDSKASLVTLERSSVYKAIQAAKVQREKATTLDGSAVPVKDIATAASITLKLVNASPIEYSSQHSNEDRAIIAKFCMATAPSDPDVNSRLLSLLSTSKVIAADFNKYLAALNPDLSADIRRGGGIGNLPRGKLADALRDFGVFIVNELELTAADVEGGKYLDFTNEEMSAFRQTLSSWRYTALGA